MGLRGGKTAFIKKNCSGATKSKCIGFVMVLLLENFVNFLARHLLLLKDEK